MDGPRPQGERQSSKGRAETTPVLSKDDAVTPETPSTRWQRLKGAVPLGRQLCRERVTLMIYDGAGALSPTPPTARKFRVSERMGRNS